MMTKLNLIDDGMLHQAWGFWPRCGVLCLRVLDTNDPDEIDCPKCCAKMQGDGGGR